MPLAGLTWAVLPGPTWLVELEVCAKADSANTQEKAPVKRTSRHVGLGKNSLIIRLNYKIIPGREKERGLLTGSPDSDVALFDADVGFTVKNKNGIECAT